MTFILDFLERKENGTLLIQKKAKLRELFLSEVELTESKDGYIHFGDKIMIMNQGWTIYPTLEHPQMNLSDLKRPPNPLLTKIFFDISNPTNIFAF